MRRSRACEGLPSRPPEYTGLPRRTTAAMCAGSRHQISSLGRPSNSTATEAESRRQGRQRVGIVAQPGGRASRRKARDSGGRKARGEKRAANGMMRRHRGQQRGPTRKFIQGRYVGGVGGATEYQRQQADSPSLRSHSTSGHHRRAREAAALPVDPARLLCRGSRFSI